MRSCEDFLWIIVMFLSAVKTVQMMKQTHLHHLKVNNFSANFHFWVTYSFNAHGFVLPLRKRSLFKYAISILLLN